MRNQTGVSFANSNCKDLQGNRKDNIIGSPQGGIASLFKKSKTGKICMSEGISQ
jgi:hypothetical protein